MKAQLIKNDYFYEGSGETDKCHREIAVLSIDDLIEKCVNAEKRKFCHCNDFAFYGSGWQSWGFGGEIDKGKYEKKYFPIVPQWKNYFNVPGCLPKRIFAGEKNPKNRKLLTGYFFIYLRWNMGKKDIYLAIASTGNVIKSLEDKILPPVKYYVDRKTRKISVTIYSDGKKWISGEKTASISIFAANDFFELKDTVENIYANDKELRFSRLKFLDSSKAGIRIAGWESWYNHYEKINAELIDGDLTCLGLTDNLIKTYFIKNNFPCIFQVDDGWEKGLGEWEADLSRFPSGMVKLAKSIENKGYVPGIWLAPFIIDWRTDFAKKHRDWILKDEKNRPIQAGFNLVWGDSFGKEQPGLPYSYYCFDLSNTAVLTYLDALMEKVINEWGFRYIKLDFLFAGLLYGKFSNPCAAYESYNKALKILTKRNTNKNGQRVAYLGCGMPFELSFNSLPLSRIGPDTKETWDINYLRRANFPARTSAFANMQSTLGHSFWNQGIFINDPDVVFLRYKNISLNDKEKILIALVNYLFASQIMHSDDPVHFENSREGYFTRFIRNLYEKFEDEIFGHVNNNSTSYFIFSKNGNYTGFINLGEKPVTINKNELRRYKSVMTNINDDTKLEKVIDFSSEKIDKKAFIFEEHSISIFKVLA